MNHKDFLAHMKAEIDGLKESINEYNRSIRTASAKLNQLTTAYNLYSPNARIRTLSTESRERKRERDREYRLNKKLQNAPNRLTDVPACPKPSKRVKAMEPPVIEFKAPKKGKKRKVKHTDKPAKQKKALLFYCNADENCPRHTQPYASYSALKYHMDHQHAVKKKVTPEPVKRQSFPSTVEHLVDKPAAAELPKKFSAPSPHTKSTTSPHKDVPAEHYNADLDTTRHRKPSDAWNDEPVKDPVKILNNPIW